MAVAPTMSRPLSHRLSTTRRTPPNLSTRRSVTSRSAVLSPVQRRQRIVPPTAAFAQLNSTCVDRTFIPLNRGTAIRNVSALLLRGFGALLFSLSTLFAPDGVAAEATPDVAVHVSVRARNADDLAALGDSPTLFLTAKPASYKVPYASRKEVWTLDVLRANSAQRYDVGRAEDLLVPAEQFGALSGILDGSDVVISARLDRDGDPNTREPEDLVGRGVAVWDRSSQGWGTADIELQGRGVFGRLVTARAK